jgi:hypothetical protein
MEAHLAYQSESVGKLAVALCKVQATMKPALKTATNPFFKSHYADLSGCLETALPVLSKNGLCVIQTTDKNLLVTTLLHESGEWIRGWYPLIAKDNSPQAMGSAVTYAKRYALCAIIGLATEDDDGQRAEVTITHKTYSEAVPTQNTDPAKPSKKQLDYIASIVEGLGWTASETSDWLQEQYGTPTRAGLTNFLASQAIEKLKGLSKSRGTM